MPSTTANPGAKPETAHQKLRAINLMKAYKKRSVVKGVSLEVESGQVVGLLGLNGAGKTTTFYMITGLVNPDEGHVYLDNRDITELAMHERARGHHGRRGAARHRARRAHLRRERARGRPAPGGGQRRACVSRQRSRGG